MSSQPRFIPALAGLAFLVVATSTGPQARAQFSIGAADQYAFISGPSVPINTAVNLNNSSYNGNVGIDNPATTAGGNYVMFSSGTVHGNFDFVGTAQTNLGGGTVTGGSVRSNISAVDSAYTTITNLSTSFAAAPNATAFPATGTVNANTGMTNTGLGANTYFFHSTVGTFLNNMPVVINGASTDYVVINVTGGQNYNFQSNGTLTLTGGITPDHVFINFVSSGSIGGNTNGGPIDGLIVGINSQINLDNSTINGRIFGGDTQAFSLVSGITINAPPASGVPEPSAIVSACTCVLIGLGWSWRRKRRAAAA
jgi:hypothetical protein